MKSVWSLIIQSKISKDLILAVTALYTKDTVKEKARSADDRKGDKHTVDTPTPAS